jgi:SAM-dependent methyltransferase
MLGTPLINQAHSDLLNESIVDFLNFYTKTNKIYGLGDSYHYGYFRTRTEIIHRLRYIVDKILPIINKHPSLFFDKTVLDFGCGTGEHTYILSKLCQSIDCYDPEPSHDTLIKSLFNISNKIKVITKNDCYSNHYDTVLISGVLECVPDYVNWFNNFCARLSCKNIILIFAPDEERLVDNFPRHFRVYDNDYYQTTTNEDELLSGIKNLSLVTRDTYSTKGLSHNNHKKIVHIYEKKISS